jgi:hypothetical protein
MNPDYKDGATVFPAPPGVAIPGDESVLSVAFRTGLIQLHALAIVVPAIVARYLYR